MDNTTIWILFSILIGALAIFLIIGIFSLPNTQVKTDVSNTSFQPQPQPQTQTTSSSSSSPFFFIFLFSLFVFILGILSCHFWNTATKNPDNINNQQYSSYSFLPDLSYYFKHNDNTKYNNLQQQQQPIFDYNYNVRYN